MEVSKERFYCPGCVVTHRNCLTWSIGWKKYKRMAFLSKITRSRHTFWPFAAMPVVLKYWLRCSKKDLCPDCGETHRNCLTWSIGWKKCKRMAFSFKIARSRHTFWPFAATPVVLECWLRCLLIALGVLQIIWLHSFAVVSILWHVMS